MLVLRFRGVLWIFSAGAAVGAFAPKYYDQIMQHALVLLQKLPEVLN